MNLCKKVPGKKVSGKKPGNKIFGKKVTGKKFCVLDSWDFLMKGLFYTELS